MSDTTENTTTAVAPEADVLVHYELNTDGSATGAVRHSDERPDLLIGQAGFVTEHEIHLAAAAGIQLTPISVKDAAEQGIVLPDGVEYDPEAEDETTAVVIDTPPQPPALATGEVDVAGPGIAPRASGAKSTAAKTAKTSPAASEGDNPDTTGSGTAS